MQDAILLVESLYDRNAIDNVKFSLSTKVADTICSGKPIIVVGNSQTGLVDYCLKNDIGLVFDESFDFSQGISLNITEEFFANMQKNNKYIFERDFNIQTNSNIFMEEIDDGQHTKK